MKTVTSLDWTIIAVFLFSSTAVMFTPPLSADEPRREIGGLSDAPRVSEERIQNKQVKLAVEGYERELAAKRAADERTAIEKQMEPVEVVRQKAQEEFDALAGDIKRIDWARCTRQLTRLRDGMKTREGKEAVNDQLHKIEVMEGMQKHFIKHAKGFTFKSPRGALRAVVTKVDDKSLTIQKAKSVNGRSVPDRETRVDWNWFYGMKEREYLGDMNLLINELVRKGRERTQIGPKEWSDHMLGAALTLQHVYGEEKGVDKFIPVLVQEAVKGFEPSRKWATKWFPDVKLEESVE